jgi:hypothetical protein
MAFAPTLKRYSFRVSPKLAADIQVARTRVTTAVCLRLGCWMLA